MTARQKKIATKLAIMCFWFCQEKLVFLSLASSSHGVVIKLDKKEKFNSVLICLDTPWYFLLHKRCIKATFSKTHRQFGMPSSHL